MKSNLNNSQLTKFEERTSQDSESQKTDRSYVGKGYTTNLANEIGLSSRNLVAHRNVNIARIFNHFPSLAIQCMLLSKTSEEIENIVPQINNLPSGNISEFRKIPREDLSLDVPDTIWVS